MATTITCLVVTPTTQGGSWTWIEEILKASSEWMASSVVSYGRPRGSSPHVRFYALPQIDYVKAGRVLSKRPLLVLNLLYFLPLAVKAWLVGISQRPTILLANGIASAAVLIPLKLFGGRVFLAFHSYTGYMGPIWDWVLKRVLRQCDVSFVNSRTSFEDISRLVASDKLSLVTHWADEIYFQVPLERPRNARIRVLFVGRLDEEKFGQCLRATSVLLKEQVAELWVVGDGPMRKHLQLLGGVRSWGYIESRRALASIYGSVDVVWSPADSTYLSRPGVEGLAAGCPLIVSDVPAVEPRARLGARVPRSLIPSDVGWVVDGHDDNEAIDLLRNLAHTGVAMETREACRAYATRHHGPQNRDLVVERLARVSA